MKEEQVYPIEILYDYWRRGMERGIEWQALELSPKSIARQCLDPYVSWFHSSVVIGYDATEKDFRGEIQKALNKLIADQTNIAAYAQVKSFERELIGAGINGFYYYYNFIDGIPPDDDVADVLEL
jgi:hypothetical protein